MVGRGMKKSVAALYKRFSEGSSEPTSEMAEGLSYRRRRGSGRRATTQAPPEEEQALPEEEVPPGGGGAAGGGAGAPGGGGAGAPGGEDEQADEVVHQEGPGDDEQADEEGTEASGSSTVYQRGPASLPQRPIPEAKRPIIAPQEDK
jgi:hypothetical protein